MPALASRARRRYSVGVRALTAVEAALAFAITGSLLAVSVPAFLKNLHASRMSEALEGLERISGRALALADAAPLASAFPAPAPLTPDAVPRATQVQDPPHTWDHPTWRILDFGFDTPHAYSFEFESKNGSDQSSFGAMAHGDLDGDGVTSTFRTSGSLRQGQPPERGVLEVNREVE